MYARAYDDDDYTEDTEDADFDFEETLRSVIEEDDEPGAMQSDFRGASEVGVASGARERRRVDELMAEARRVRMECDELVHRYQQAVRGGGRARERSMRPGPSHAAGLGSPRRRSVHSPEDRAARKKALLVMLIEELL